MNTEDQYKRRRVGKMTLWLNQKATRKRTINYLNSGQINRKTDR